MARLLPARWAVAGGLVIVAAACASGQEVPPELTGTWSRGGVTADSIMGARTEFDDPSRVIIFFTGGAPYDGGPCTTDYRATAEEDEEDVLVTFETKVATWLEDRIDTPKPVRCQPVGVDRTVVVDLMGPLGARRLLHEDGRAISVVDGPSLAQPGFLPEAWDLAKELPNGEHGWSRTWAATKNGSTNECVHPVRAITLTERPDGPAPGPESPLLSDRTSQSVTFVWADGDRLFILRADQCVGQQFSGEDAETFALRFAGGLEVPA